MNLKQESERINRVCKAWSKMDREARMGVREALECALTGHPLEIRIAAAKRFWKKHVIGRVK